MVVVNAGACRTAAAIERQQDTLRDQTLTEPDDVSKLEVLVADTKSPWGDDSRRAA